VDLEEIGIESRLCALATVSWNPTVLVSSLVLVVSLAKKTLI
jgi:hypothetical protein